MVYLPEHFAETDLESMHRLIRENALGAIISVTEEGLIANHIPFVLDAGHGPHGRLLGHVARSNPLWHAHIADVDALVIFQAADAYITPNWYPSKHEHGSVVPTWNYAVVHVYGSLVVHDDPKWVRGQAGLLTMHHEASQPKPWKMADAPRAYTEALIEQIVGIEVPISRIIGKTKASQNRSDHDRIGVIEGLNANGESAMASIVAAKLDAQSE